MTTQLSALQIRQIDTNKLAQTHTGKLAAYVCTCMYVYVLPRIRDRDRDHDHAEPGN